MTLCPWLLTETLLWDHLQYLAKHTGPFSYNQISAIGVFNTESPLNRDWPNHFAAQIPVGMHEAFGSDLDFFYGLKKGTMGKYVKDYVGEDSNWVLLNLGRPKSRGTVTLSSKDPYQAPIIDMKYYHEPSDLDEMVKAVKVIVNLYEKTNAWQKYGAKLIDTPFPGCEGAKRVGEDAYYKCYLQYMSGTTWHPCGTARMGRKDDPKAVLDSKLRVLGVTGLRVADTSIMPDITNANLNAPAIMIGEKASDFIKKQWNPIN